MVVTGRADDALAMESVRAGAQDYLVKGHTDASELRRALRYAVERQRLMGLAQQATLARDEMLAIVSHDLRNAIGTIKMSVQALQEPVPMAPDQVRRLLEASERAANWMTRLIQDLLDVSRLEAGQLALAREPVVAADIVNALTMMFGSLAERQGVSLAVSGAACPTWIHADPDRLVQALGNLVGNAIKFTPAGGQVTLSAAAEAIGGVARVRFVVADTGQGIAPDDLPHVFDRFWQAQRSRRGGAGLGLAIARGIIEAHGGTLDVESTLGVGSTFACAIPATAAPPVP